MFALNPNGYGKMVVIIVPITMIITAVIADTTARHEPNSGQRPCGRCPGFRATSFWAMPFPLVPTRLYSQTDYLRRCIWAPGEGDASVPNLVKHLDTSIEASKKHEFPEPLPQGWAMGW
jgi:hypothetical protein